ncbi:MAG TPA: hypothetical protein EYP19_10970 [Desulfobacterales bacterium]|nr:hypothetical protein [Desulfobacterales bacterium]
METTIEKLQDKFHEMFPNWELSDGKAAEWLDAFGFNACLSAFETARSSSPKNPLAYTFAILRDKADKKESKGKKDRVYISPYLRERYETYIESGDLTSDEVNILCRARAGQKIDHESLLSAEYRLRRAVYSFNSRLWCPSSVGYWERRAWSEMSDEERGYWDFAELTERGKVLANQWANSEEYQRMESLGVDALVEEIFG